MNAASTFLRNKIFLMAVIILLLGSIALVSVRFILPATQKAPVQTPLPTPRTQVAPTTYSLQVEVGSSQEPPVEETTPSGTETSPTTTPTTALLAQAQDTPTPTVLEGLGGAEETPATSEFTEEEATPTPVSDLPESGIATYSTSIFVIALIIMGLAFVL